MWLKGTGKSDSGTLLKEGEIQVNKAADVNSRCLLPASTHPCVSRVVLWGAIPLVRVWGCPAHSGLFGSTPASTHSMPVTFPA